jgi:hypothetical protein
MHLILKNKSKWLPPLLFLMVLVFAFGLLLPSLGFYWDDWPPILIGKMQGTHMCGPVPHPWNPTINLAGFRGWDPLAYHSFLLADSM